MACGGCAARRAALAASQVKYVWTSEPDENGQRDTVIYDKEVSAKAKVMRKGGSYKPKTG